MRAGLLCLSWSLIVAFSAYPAAANPVPLVAQPLVPAAVAPGGPSFTLTVNGTGFVAGATVDWNGSPRVTTFVSLSQLTATITAADIATAGTAKITVVNPTPGGGTSNVVLFQVTNPTTGVVFASPFSVTMAGNPPYIHSAGSPLGVDEPIAADLNGDGKADLIAPVTSSPGSVSVSLAGANGTFLPPVTYVYDPNNAGGFVYGLAVADFNGDGIPDILVTFATVGGVSTSNVTSVLFGSGDGTFKPAVTSTQILPVSQPLVEPKVADLNGDGKLDLIGAGPVVLLGNGDGTFTYASSQNLARGTYAGVLLTALGDFNGDGKLDLVATVDPSYVVLFLGNGDGTFQPYTILFNSYTNGGQGGIVAADFNGDGKLDIAYYHNECTDAGIGPCEGHLDFLCGNGDGTFQFPQTLGGLATIGNSPELIAGDFNGDGTIDLAFGGNLLLLGIGGPSPFSYSLLTIPNNQLQNVAGDFNGDGRLDIMGVPVSNTNVATLNVALQTSPDQDFSAATAQGYQTVVAGNPATYTINITAIDGFTGVVTPSVSGLPSGASASFNPATVSGSGSTVLTVTTTSVPTGSYALPVSLTSGAITHGGSLTLNVGPAGTDFTDFTGSIPKTYSNTTPGSAVGYGITIIPTNGFTGTVSFSVSGLPAGATFAFSPATVTGGSGSTNLMVTTAASTPTGTYPFTITATSGSHTHSTGLVVNVGPPGYSFGDFTGSITPTSLSVVQGSSATITISLQPLYGFTGNAQVSLDPLPAGSGIGASGNAIFPVPGSTVVTMTTSPTTPTGTYTLTFHVTGGNASHSATVTLNVP